MNPTLTNLISALAEELGQSEALKRYAFAKESYETDEVLSAHMAALTAQRAALAAEYAADPRDEDKITAISTRINELYALITDSEAYTAFETASSEKDSFMQSVYDAIAAMVGGGGGCGSGCGSCGGCGGH
ncbi:MAG: YlbF family regulator [Oscillospiraceae bacterium]|nr:YlbF family regulator [Oscillospiraceae bacterium]